MNANTKDTTSQACNTRIYVSVAMLLVAMAKLMTPSAIRGALVIKLGHVGHSGTILCTQLVCLSFDWFRILN